MDQVLCLVLLLVPPVLVQRISPDDYPRNENWCAPLPEEDESNKPGEPIDPVCLVIGVKALKRENRLLKEENDKLKKENEEFRPAEDGTHDIWQALVKNSIVGVKHWLAKDPSSINKKNSPHYYSYTPLIYASENGQLDIVKFLVSQGAEIDAANTENQTPLMWACWKGHLEIVKLLLSKGANVNQMNVNKGTPLHWAVLGNHFDIVKVLVEAGAEK